MPQLRPAYRATRMNRLKDTVSKPVMKGASFGFHARSSHQQKATMNISTTNVPPQALRLLTGDQKVRTYEASGGTVTSQFAAYNLSLAPPLPHNAVVHDNACGPGTVSRLLLANGNPQNITIHATDMDPPFVSVLSSQVKENNWPIEVTNQKSEALSFSDNYFDLSVMNFGIFFTTNAGLDGAKEIFRTLKPGGTAIANCWGQITWLKPILANHDYFRPGKPFPTPVVQWHDGEHIQQVMKDAGFKEENVTIHSSEGWMEVKKDGMREWAENLWAYLGGIAGWAENDAEKWDQALDKLVELALAQPGTEVVGDEVRMKATQWVVVAKK
ncbi:S-adenosyl-L-methionine-dependent methyltransferase, partial [Coprinopsis sp. MPI-PUGE-AT-0042]